MYIDDTNDCGFIIGTGANYDFVFDELVEEYMNDVSKEKDLSNDWDVMDVDVFLTQQATVKNSNGWVKSQRILEQNDAFVYVLLGRETLLTTITNWSVEMNVKLRLMTGFFTKEKKPIEGWKPKANISV